VADLASRQHGRVAHWQLLALGLSPSAIHRGARGGWLHREHHGVYAVGHRAADFLGRWMSGVLACGPDAVLSHRNAAALHDLRPMSSSVVDVTALGRRSPRGVKVHRVRRLHPDDCTVVKRIPVTGVARTALDCAEILSLRQTIRLLEQAERLGVFDLNAIEAVLARNPGRHGMRALKRAIAELSGEPAHANSDWERGFLDFCEDHNLPKPELNATVEGYVVDALWRGAKLIVELDSWSHHRSRSAFEEDRHRDAVLQIAGYVVPRITWRRFEREPVEVAALIRRRVSA
jgi:hypothetical protein